MDMEGFAKSFVAKATANQLDATDREFTAIVSAFNIVDSEGDVILPGAFRDEIARLKESGQPLPAIFDHQHNNPDAYFGDILEMEELEPGDYRLAQADEKRAPGAPTLIDKGALWIRGRSDDNPDAEKVHRQIKGGRVKQWSFFALGGDAAPTTFNGRTVRAISRVRNLIEVGPTLRGMNTSTATLTAKSHQPTGETQLVTPDDDVAGDRARFMQYLSLYQ